VGLLVCVPGDATKRIRLQMQMAVGLYSWKAFGPPMAVCLAVWRIWFCVPGCRMEHARLQLPMATSFCSFWL
jgi:hypothetical protein